MAVMNTISPTLFVALKKRLAKPASRDPKKRPKDASQATLVQAWIDGYMPQYHGQGQPGPTLHLLHGVQPRETDKNVNFYKLRNQMCHLFGRGTDKNGPKGGFFGQKQVGTEPAAWIGCSVDGFFNFKE
ncbi:MAG: hypothetical protein IBX54_10810 [Rhodoferax sp.]|nr:hypothetical protein [Rhodoferax sp.]